MRLFLLLPALSLLLVAACGPAEDDDSPTPTPILLNAPVINSITFSLENNFGDPLYWIYNSQTGAMSPCNPATDADCYRGVELQANTHDDDGDMGRSTFLLEILNGTTLVQTLNFIAEVPDATDLNWILFVHIGHPTNGIDANTEHTFRLTMTDNGGMTSDPFEQLWTTPNDY